MCVVRSRSCRWRETAARGNATRGKKGRKKCVSRAGKRVGCSERVQRTEIATSGREMEGGRERERRKKSRVREGERNARVHRGPIIRAGRPITYWFFTYDLIHYHSVIYICPTCCGFRGFALRTRETQEKMQPHRDARDERCLRRIRVSLFRSLSILNQVKD